MDKQQEEADFNVQTMATPYLNGTFYFPIIQRFTKMTTKDGRIVGIDRPEGFSDSEWSEITKRMECLYYLHWDKEPIKFSEKKQ